jgi:hypothetical protein
MTRSDPSMWLLRSREQLAPQQKKSSNSPNQAKASSWFPAPR